MTESLIEWALAHWEFDPDGARCSLLEHSRSRFEALAHRMLRRDFPRLGSLEQTDDIVQGAQVRLLRALVAMRPDSAADVFRLAAVHIRRELLDLARHYFGPHGLGHQRPLAGASSSGGASPELAGGTTCNPERMAAWTEMHERAASLPDDLRAVVDLIYYQGLTRVEAARALGLSESTVKRRWVAARLELGACLVEYPTD